MVELLAEIFTGHTKFIRFLQEDSVFEDKFKVLNPKIHPSPLKLNSVEYFHKRNIFCLLLFQFYLQLKKFI